MAPNILIMYTLKNSVVLKKEGHDHIQFANCHLLISILAQLLGFEICQNHVCHIKAYKIKGRLQMRKKKKQRKEGKREGRKGKYWFLKKGYVFRGNCIYSYHFRKINPFLRYNLLIISPLPQLSFSEVKLILDRKTGPNLRIMGQCSRIPLCHVSHNSLHISSLSSQTVIQ